MFYALALVWLRFQPAMKVNKENRDGYMGTGPHTVQGESQSMRDRQHI